MCIRDTEIKVKLAPTNPGDVEQIINESRFQFGVFHDHAKMLTYRFWYRWLFDEERTGKQNGGEGRSQFMTKHRQKTILRPASHLCAPSRLLSGGI